MALSEINISNVVLLQTNALIASSDYQLLRQNLLELKPIAAVISQVQFILTQHCESDKHAWQKHYTETACLAQIDEDQKAALTDEKEREQDQLLAERYKQDLPAAENRLLQMDQKEFAQQSIYNRANSELDTLRVTLAHTIGAVSTITEERRLLEQPSHHSHPSENHVTHHHHTQEDTLAHVHTHPSNTQGHVVDVVPPNSVLDKNSWQRLHRRELSLIQERNKLRHLVALRENEIVRERQTLETIQDEKQKLSDYCKDVIKHLDSILPKKAQQRHIRQQQRMNREIARTGSDPQLNQLSASNIVRLYEQISSQSKLLEQTKEQLVSKAVDISYQTYLTQVDQSLQQPQGLKASYFEIEALKSLVSTLKSYQLIEQEEKQIRDALSFAQKTLGSLQSRYNDNVSLTQENAILHKTGEAAGSMRATSLYLALFGGAGSLASAGVGYAYAINPLLFLVPEVLGVLTVIALVVALAYHIQKSGIEDQLVQNNNKIVENEQTSSVDPQLTPAANLMNQIQIAGQQVTQLDLQLKDKQSNMCQLLGKARNVTAGYGTSTGAGFFPTQKGMDTNPTPLYPSFDPYKPSAPPQYD